MRSPLSFRRLVVALAVSPLVLTACGGGGGGSAPAPSVTGAGADDRQVKGGGTLTVALNADPDALDPSLSTTLVGREVFVNMCEKLYDIDATSALVPQLAAELPEVSEDGKTVTIKLRTGLKFNDGTTLDAAAVKKSLDRHRTWEKSSRQADLAAVEEVTVVDPETVSLALSRPFTPLTAQLADRAGMIMSPKALDSEGDNFGAGPVCVGPFKFAGRTSGSEIRLERAPDYYDAAKVKLDKLTYKIIVDPNVRAANLKSGDVQVADQLATTTVAGVQADPNLGVVSGGGLGFYGFTINVGNAKGATEKPGKVDTALAGDPRLREAFELSLDRDVINKTVYNGLYEPDCFPLPLKSPYRSPDLKCPPHDPAKAKQLVTESGVKTPIPVTLLSPNDATNQRLAQVIQQMVKDAGFAVTVQTAEFVTTLEQGREGKFDAFLNGWSGRVDPDGNVTNLITSGGTNNFGGMSDPGIDDPIKEAAATGDVNERRDLYAKAVQRAAEIRSVIYLYHNKYYLGMNKNVAGVKYYEDGLPRFTTAGLAQ
ncbi:peptide/nickel transport system substrate-binding protein [Streptosporangium subroseum]|uniref:Peptide/nickel transport system substrate-binding protein n=1 Tax=Streptosporangium subroseum TaxID=106412 RepID=A0A239A240_9ACTN|nr:ABC transporter substrate-binding protein [Streptosporangium subroseum]SNR89746.1 peptide/nickel transport system substrate-binding protein [Streptosporangium subroseum]